LKPLYKDTFGGAGLDVVKFFRDARGNAMRFDLYTSGLRGLRFERVKK
jgi:hypothetical protein